jgi:hypothetical protein
MDAFKAMNDPSNDLASLLVTPVQRIPRYLMLVKSMLKHSYPGHPDYAKLRTAEERISAIAIIVDQKAKDFENVQKMHHLDSIIEGNDFALLDPQRKFTHMGHVLCEKKKSKLFSVSKAPREFGLFLFSDLFVLAEQNADKKTYRFYRRIELLGCEAAEEKGHATAFRIVQEGAHDEAYVFTTRSEDDKKVWLDHFAANIRENNSKAATLRNVRNEQDKKKATTRSAASMSVGATASGASLISSSPPTGSWRHVGVSNSSEPPVPVKGQPSGFASVRASNNSRASLADAAKTSAVPGSRGSGEAPKTPSPRPPLPSLPVSGLPGAARPVSPRGNAPVKSPTMPQLPQGVPMAAPRKPVPMSRSSDKTVQAAAAAAAAAATAAVATVAPVVAHVAPVALPPVDDLPPPQVDLSEFRGVMRDGFAVMEPNGMVLRAGESVTVLDKNFSPGWLYVRNDAGLCGAVPVDKVGLIDEGNSGDGGGEVPASDMPPLPDFSLDDSGNVVSGTGSESTPPPLESANSESYLIPPEISDFLAHSPDEAFGGAFQAAPPAMTAPHSSAEDGGKKGSHERKHSSLRGFFGFGEPGSPNQSRHNKKQSPKPSPRMSPRPSPRQSPTGSPEVSPRTDSMKAMKVLGL